MHRSKSPGASTLLLPKAISILPEYPNLAPGSKRGIKKKNRPKLLFAIAKKPAVFEGAFGDAMPSSRVKAQRT